jgi:putative transposase
MARRKRVAPVGVPQHIIQRGNNRHACFSSTSDMKAYINWLRDYASEYEVEIHAWVLMTNHYLCEASHIIHIFYVLPGQKTASAR